MSNGEGLSQGTVWDRERVVESEGELGGVPGGIDDFGQTGPFPLICGCDNGRSDVERGGSTRKFMVRTKHDGDPGNLCVLSRFGSGDRR